MKSPTVLPLAKEGWSSVHSVLNKNEFWEIIDELKQNGAEGILVCPIEKMVLQHTKFISASFKIKLNVLVESACGRQAQSKPKKDRR